MWPFKLWRERAKVRAAFSRYLPDDLIDELVKRPAAIPSPPQPVQLCFILLQVRDDPLDQVPAHLSKAIDVIMRRDGMLWDVMSSIALATFGLPISDDPGKDRDQRSKVVARLVTELGSDIRLLDGDVGGFLANCGSPSRFHYGPLLPDFRRYLSALTALEFGHVAEA